MTKPIYNPDALHWGFSFFWVEIKLKENALFLRHEKK